MYFIISAVLLSQEPGRCCVKQFEWKRKQREVKGGILLSIKTNQRKTLFNKKTTTVVYFNNQLGEFLSFSKKTFMGRTLIIPKLTES